MWEISAARDAYTTHMHSAVLDAARCLSVKRCSIYRNGWNVLPRDAMLARYAVIMCPSVRLSLCHKSEFYIQWWLNLGSRKQRRTIAQGLQIIDAKDLGKYLTASPPTVAPNRGGVGYNYLRRFLTNISLYLRNGARKGYS